MKKIVWCALALLMPANMYALESYVSVGAGPTWIDLQFIEVDSVIDDPTLNRTSIYKINTASGYTVDINAKYHCNPYINPYLDVCYSHLTKGNGFIDVFLEHENQRKTTLDTECFKPIIKSVSFIIANITRLIESTFCKKPYNADLLVGYSYSKFLLISQTVDSGISNSIYQGFVAGLQLTYFYTSTITLIVEDYVYPERIDTTSTRQSLLGKDAGFSSYILMGNLLIGLITYAPTESWSFSLCGSWAYYKNVGKATILLSKEESTAFKEPMLCVSSGNQYTLLLYINYNF